MHRTLSPRGNWLRAGTELAPSPYLFPTSQVRLHDGITTALPIEYPVGFVYLDDGKARFYNAPLMAYLRDKLMVGAIVAMDDPWQEEGFHVPSSHHYGQAMLGHELSSGGDFRFLFSTPMPPRNALGSPLGRSHGKPPARFLRSMEKFSNEAELKGLFEPTNTIALRRTRSRLGRAAATTGEMSSHEQRLGLQVRVSLVDANGAEVESVLVSGRNLTGARRPRPQSGQSGSRGR